MSTPTTELAARSEPAGKRYTAQPATHAAWHRQAALSAAIRGGRLITENIARAMGATPAYRGTAEINHARLNLAAGLESFWSFQIAPSGSGSSSARIRAYAERERGDPPARLWEYATTWPLMLAGAARIYVSDEERATLDAIDYLTNPSEPFDAIDAANADALDALTCDDCGRKDGTHDPDIEH